ARNLRLRRPLHSLSKPPRDWQVRCLAGFYQLGIAQTSNEWSLLKSPISNRVMRTTVTFKKHLGKHRNPGQSVLTTRQLLIVV
ncbi:hypothetical protein NPIL_527791, partial [Nephila pilipes]